MPYFQYTNLNVRFEEERRQSREEIMLLKNSINKASENITAIRDLIEEYRRVNQENVDELGNLLLNRINATVFAVAIHTYNITNIEELLEEERRQRREEIMSLKNIIKETSENASLLIHSELDSFAAEFNLTGQMVCNTSIAIPSNSTNNDSYNPTSPPAEEGTRFCNLTSGNWSRVAYINMTDPDQECPNGLQEILNTDTGQRACGRNVGGQFPFLSCSSVTFPASSAHYHHVCGYARGYQLGNMNAFLHALSRTIDETYVDGLSFTHGTPREHIWTLAVGRSEHNDGSACPRD